jgi:DNA-binding transcriptional MerR regulator
MVAHSFIADPQEGPLIKMKDLLKATGASKATILYYLKEGLIPLPVRTKRNMAYYRPACIERVRFIKDLQSRYRLPLAAIRKVLEERDQGHDVLPLIEMGKVVFGSKASNQVNQKVFCRMTGLTPEQVEECLASDLLLPFEKGLFDEEDIAIGQFLKGGFDVGLSVKDLDYYPHLAKETAKKEMAIRMRLTKDLSFERNVSATMELTRAARSLRNYIFERQFQRSAASQAPSKNVCKKKKEVKP